MSFRHLLVLGAALLLTGCYAELDWREFSSPEGRFSVLLPGKPSKATREVTLGGGKVSMNMYSVSFEGLAFGVGYADLAPGSDPAPVLAEMRNGLVANIAGKVTAEKPIAPANAVGTEFFADGRAGENPMRLGARVLASGTRVYQIVYLGRPERTDAVDATLYLGSFRVTSP